MQSLIFLSVATGTYYLMSFLQAVLHRSHGHRRRINAIFEAHAIRHHGQYPVHRLRGDTFVAHESHALYYYGIPIAVIAVLFYLAFSPLVMAAYLAGVLVTFAWHVYIHRQYHLNETPLERFAWFRKKRHLHDLHHADARVNYAVVEFWVDTLMGTRKN